MDISKALLTLVEKPKVPQPYRDLFRVLTEIGRPEDAAAVEYLIQQKFSNVNRSRTDA